MPWVLARSLLYEGGKKLIVNQNFRRIPMPYQNFPNQVNETPGTKYYCTCGESANKPYCDGSHETAHTGKNPAKVEIAEAKQVAICDCGKTGTSPFCDGSHSKITVAALS